jgi:solute carrier family 35 protein E3
MEFIQQNFASISSIASWYLFNVTTVVLNKYLYQVLGFKYPFSLTTIHMIVCFIGSFIALRTMSLPQFPFKKISNEVYLWKVLPLSILFCLNIILGNISLRFVPVSFMQTVKSSVPAFSVALQVLFMGKEFDSKTYMSVFLVVFGVAASTVSEIEFEMTGFLCAVVSSITTAAQAILIGKVLTGEHRLDSMNLVYYMALPSAIILLPFCYNYELDKILYEWDMLNLSGILILFASGAIAYGLNVTSFLVVKHTSALTYNVAGNFKIILSIAVSVLIFRNPIGLINILGCAIAIVGVWMYNTHRMHVNRLEQEGKKSQEKELNISIDIEKECDDIKTGKD